jgi:energy-coupling factor transporter ATP-binding protein EcfA2
LGVTDSITLAFTYRDMGGTETAPIEKADLVKVLSNGELKALYILNVIFEIATRTEAQQETLIIIDDLADSFDYRNKYAIIQYLKEISENALFKQIIMTHNFDFFRTIQSRLVVEYANCLMASKGDAGIALVQAAAIKNIFADWKKYFFTDDRKKIACISFLRNLAEFTKGVTDANYLKLTSLLHWKPDTAAIKISDLDTIFSAVCAPGGPSKNATMLVSDLIAKQADACLTADTGVNFENKIVLAIATRLAAERFMIGKINDAAFVNAISSDQTPTLITRFRKDFPGEAESIRVLDRVALMTPENIHLNSFMYEPIVDMSDDHLKKLYKDVKKLA